MWGYYGSKTQIIHHYPEPTYTSIIEPFAGTAKYSLQYFDKDITIIDKYDIIIKVWKWLQLCNKNDILSLPVLKLDDNIDNYHSLCDEARWLIGFNIGIGLARPRKTPSKLQTLDRPHIQKALLERIADSLYKIKHWNIIHGDYFDVVNKKATWFIDPPYIKGGEYYRESSRNINFDYLKDWCISRKGQVIVCERSGAKWLPFKHLVINHGRKRSTREAVFVKVTV